MEITENGKETYFSHKERIFPELQNGKIPTNQFLLACQGIADFVGLFCLFFLKNFYFSKVFLVLHLFLLKMTLVEMFIKSLNYLKLTKRKCIFFKI